MSNEDNLYFGLDFDYEATTPINFLETRFNDLSPFSAHQIEIDGVPYKTAEHAYQALRVLPEARVGIINAGSPMDAWRLGQKCKIEGKLLPDIDKLALMEIIFRAKVSQYSDIAKILKVSGERELLKVYDSDYFWGTGADGSGENQMGKLWMKLRSELIK